MARPPAWKIRLGALKAGLRPAWRPADRGAGGHPPYFAALAAALRMAGVAQPTLVIDRRRLEANLARVRRTLGPSGLAVRAVSKSLQAPALLEAVLGGLGGDRIMVFNGVMLEEVADFRPDGDVLTGRPLPAVQVEAFVRRHLGDERPAARPQWLVDSHRRLTQYRQIARANSTTLRLNFEIDIGLRRGGFADPRSLALALDAALTEPLFEVSGLMGYDPHLAAAPPAEAAMARSRYEGAWSVLAEKTGKGRGAFTLNTAGSLTFSLHLSEAVANEVSIGSAFLKPAHFDTPLLADLEPALFLAEPVLKAVEPALIPGLEHLAGAIEAADPNAARGFFLYGGYGDARVVSPPGLAWSRLWGGRALLTGSRRVVLDQDEFVFLRPTESEGTLLQFGDIAVFDGETISAWWPTFAVAA